jgi:hypothetical protein
MTINSSANRKQLQEGLNTVFGLAYKEHKTQYTEIFDTETSSKKYEEDVIMSGFGAAQTKGEGAPVAYDSGQEAWVARYQHITVALAFSLTKEAEEDGLYGSLGGKYAKSLAHSMRYTKELHGANVLNNGFSSSYTGGDGKALFATDHPLTGGGTFANKLTTAADLSETSLEDALIAIDGFVNERGIPIQAQAKKLIVPRQLRYVASRILKSEFRTGTGDNDINAIYHTDAVSGGYCVNHYLSDADAWYIKTDCMDGMKHFQRKALARGMEGDFETDNMRYKARERYSFGWTDPRGAFASEGAA